MLALPTPNLKGKCKHSSNVKTLSLLFLSVHLSVLSTTTLCNQYPEFFASYETETLTTK